MLAIAYHFPVLPRYRDQFQHAWRAARGSLQKAIGLVSCELTPPRERHDTFVLLLAWDSQASFERFTRTWVGVWMLNGMGLQREAFAESIRTNIGAKGFEPRTDRHAT